MRCTEKQLRIKREYRLTHPIEQARNNKKFTDGNRPQTAARLRRYRKSPEGRIATRKTDARRRVRLKIDVLTKYGGGKCECVRCGFSDVRALSLDHIYGNGNEHRRRETFKGGVDFYRALKQAGYPSGYQTLCMNCQFIKRVENKELSYRGTIEEHGPVVPIRIDWAKLQPQLL
jgi:hypothetical protein